MFQFQEVQLKVQMKVRKSCKNYVSIPRGAVKRIAYMGEYFCDMLFQFQEVQLKEARKTPKQKPN